jgi:hypothetical protein
VEQYLARQALEQQHLRHKCPVAINLLDGTSCCPAVCMWWQELAMNLTTKKHVCDQFGNAWQAVRNVHHALAAGTGFAGSCTSAARTVHKQGAVTLN